MHAVSVDYGRPSAKDISGTLVPTTKCMEGNHFSSVIARDTKSNLSLCKPTSPTRLSVARGHMLSCACCCSKTFQAQFDEDAKQ